MKVMVSVWPFSAVGSSSIDGVANNSLAVKTQADHKVGVWWDDNNCNAKCYLLDQSQADTRSFFWQQLDKGYYKNGIKIYWLDASEPEISTSDAKKAAVNSFYSAGSTQAAGMMYPYWHTQAVHDGLISAGEKAGDTIMLTRSAWAGMQRWGAALWSGDTHSSFNSLKVSVQAGLNTQMSGIGMLVPLYCTSHTVLPILYSPYCTPHTVLPILYSLYSLYSL
jgi:alpha-D-xyloside xylohydrolase